MQNFLQTTKNFFEPIKNFLESTEFFWNNLENILIAIFIFFWILALRFALQIFFDKKIKIYVEKSKTKADNIIFSSVQRFIKFWFLILAFYFAKFSIILPESTDDLVNKILTVTFTWFVIFLIQKLFADLIWYFFSCFDWEKYLASMVKNISNIVVYWLWASLVLSQLWYNVSTLVAWLWIWWLAVALAVQPILSSIIASFSLFFDKPFKVWDIIRIWDTLWIISEIWLRNVRIKTFHWTEVIMWNMDVLNWKIENISFREKVREDFWLWIIYEISTEKLKEWMKILREILSSKDWIDKDIRILFSDFWDFSLNLKITYFFDGSLTFDERLALKSEINLEIKERFEQAGIDFAYPTAVRINKNV